jgi:hypothetical protein
MISSACGKRWFGSALANSRFVVANTAARYEVRKDVRWWLVLTTFIVVLGRSLYAFSEGRVVNFCRCVQVCIPSHSCCTGAHKASLGPSLQESTLAW